MDHEIVVDELGGPNGVGVNSADLCGSEDHSIRTLSLKKRADSHLVGKVELAVRARDQFEVVTNSLKYAFADRRTGKITIRLEPIGEGRARLVIADNGVGFDAAAVRTGMGSKLIKGVVDQLDGSFAYDFDNGTTFTLDFALHSRNAR